MKRKEYPCPECGRIIYFDGLCYECRQRKIREKYQAMSEAEIAAKVEAIIAALDNTFYKKEERDDLLGLLAYRDISTEKIAEAAAQAGVYYPCEIYRDAAPEVRAKLIALLMQPHCPEANHILQCLAIAGGDDVLAAFAALEQRPQPWRKKLFVAPSVYAQAGGWTFGKDGKRIVLNYDHCYPVFPASDCVHTDTAVSVAAPREDICPHCGSHLTDILTLNGKDERLAFLNLPGVVKIPICPMCAAMCERTIIRYTPNGDSTMEIDSPFWDGGKMSDDEYAAMTSKAFALAKKSEPLFFARGSDESIITIGGFANWIQDFQYDLCPDCGKTMRYFASVPWNTLSDYTEGTLYLEICPDCRIISTFHQQT